ncbi:MAG: serine hydrolase domain-containing protein [Tepidisphaerales bacterium]
MMLRSIAAILVMLALGPAVSAGEAPGAVAGGAAAQADATDAYIQSEMQRQHIPGLSLVVVRDGHIVRAKGYGLANVELNVPATPETVYQIQSVTKQFTATAIMMLVEEGKIALDEKVGTYLAGAPEKWDKITVRHLLTHTSGIKDFINEPTASLRLDVSEEEVFKATAPRPLNFAPGERYAYSNTNYHLLAMMIRKITGKSFGDFLQQRIFEPLGMSQTRIISLTEIIPNRAAGYLWQNGALRNGEFVAPTILGYGGGGIRSTVLDMAKWDAALYTEKLLKKSSLEQMWTPMKFNDGKPSGYGFGWGVSAVRGHKLLSHTGSHATGFSSVISRFVDDKLTVIVLANRGGADATRIATRVAGFYVAELAAPETRPSARSEYRL